MVKKHDADRALFVLSKDASGNIQKIRASGLRGGELLASIQKTNDGVSYLAAGANVTIASQSNGQVTISATTAASVNAQFLVLDFDATLTEERRFVAGTGLSADDAGAGGDYTLSVNDSVVATVSGTTFTGATLHDAGLSGSLTRLSDGTSYLIAGSNITITSVSNGAVTIASTTGGTGADSAASFVVIANTASLANERALAASDGVSLLDGGADNSVTLSADGTVARISGSHFTGNITVVGTGSFEGGISGSLTRLVDGTSYLIAGSNITITSASNGAVTIASTAAGGSGADSAAAYVVLNATSSLSNERVLTGSDGIVLLDGGAGSDVTLSVDGTVARISGSHFTGNITVVGTGSFEGGISGSLTQLTDGTSYLVAGVNVTVTSASNGAITVSVPNVAPSAEAFVTIGNSANLSAERALIQGTGILFVDGGANTGVTASIDDSIVATVSGTTFTGQTNHTAGISGSNIQLSGTGSFTGVTTHLAGMSGSLTRLTDGSSYIIAGSNVTVTSASNGAVTLSAPNLASSTEAYITIGNSSGLSAERALVAGTGILFTDGGANTGVTGSIDDSVVATVSGTTFTGVTLHNAGLSGSLTRLTDGTSYIQAGTNVTVTSASNGAVTISAASLAASDEAYVTIGNTAGLSAERALIAGAGIVFVDGGANTGVTASIDDSVVATVSGTTFTGQTNHTAGVSGSNIQLSGTGSFTGVTTHLAGMSGSLTQLTDGSSYIIAGSNVSVASASNGAVTISAPSLASSAEAFITVGNSSGLSAERALIAGTGINFVDGGANTGMTASINDSVVATVSGTTFTGQTNHTVGISGSNIQLSGTGSFTGVTTHLAGLSGSLTRLSTGASFIEAGANVTVTSASNGAITISSTTDGTVDASYLVLGLDGVLTDERVFTPGDGLTATDAGANGSYTLAADGTVARVSGTHFTGNITVVGTGSFEAGISGSLTRLIDGTSYLIAGSNVTITSASNGAVTIASSDVTGADSAATYVVLNATSSLSNERVLTGSDGITLVDGGAGGDVTLRVDGTVARISGSHFTGNITVVGTGSFEAGVSGSLTRLIDGTSYLIAGSNIAVTSASNGGVTIAASGLAASDEAYVTIGNSANLSAERALVAGTGINFVDGGANTGVTASINDSVVATVSGTTFTGATKHNAGLSGSLTRLTDGTSYIAAGENITITSSSNGQVIISSNMIARSLTTSDATPSSLFTQVMTSGDVLFLKGLVRAKTSDASIRNGYERSVTAWYTGSVANTGSVQDDFTFESDTALNATWIASGSDVILQVTGKAGTTVLWVANIIVTG